jgi:hypothetical protein
VALLTSPSSVPLVLASPQATLESDGARSERLTPRGQWIIEWPAKAGEHVYRCLVATRDDLKPGDKVRANGPPGWVSMWIEGYPIEGTVVAPSAEGCGLFFSGRPGLRGLREMPRAPPLFAPRISPLARSILAVLQDIKDRTEHNGNKPRQAQRYAALHEACAVVFDQGCREDTLIALLDRARKMLKHG